MTRPIDNEVLSDEYQWKIMGELNAYRKERALSNLMNIHMVPQSDLTSLLENTEKEWDSKCEKKGKRNVIAGMINAAESHFYVPKINMLKSLIGFRKEVEKNTGNKEEKVSNYLNNQGSNFIEELSSLDIYFNQIPKYPRMDELKDKKEKFPTHFS